ncbi:hypothetical protein [Fibrella forsythiae]|uniref:LPXTG cell wall anchor domain-containing protein n=1 Tax=Fibrella forsythiae TaxID=2817061 RepID=A0ABS3JM44_9BACT|nr:hypothetical protein [Fibrella forsythiae]MBO0951084.1 hypothetical protein [Fibrella forsythiae]
MTLWLTLGLGVAIAIPFLLKKRRNPLDDRLPAHFPKTPAKSSKTYS